MYFVPNVNNADAFMGQLHTGDPDGLYWDPPTLPQNFVIRFPSFTLSAADGDFTDAGITITSEAGDSEDITIGNAPAKILSATALNPDGLMDGLNWGIGKAAITVPGLETTFDGTGYIIYAEREEQQYGFTNTVMDAPNATANYSGEPQAIVVKSNGYAYFITDEVVYFYNGSSIAPFTPATDLQKFEVDKYKKYQNIGVYLGNYDVPPFDDPDPAKTWVVNEDDPAQSLRHTVIDLPVGTFDFSNVDAHGITFGIEVYDLMTRFDADATAWVQSLDFTTPMTIVDILESLLSELGYQSNYTINTAAVNTALTYTENPITAYAATYRQVLKRIAEAMGCNVRMSRTGGVELWAWNSTSRETITSYTIISNTRTKARYTVPQITEVVCYDTLGMNYASGSEGVPYYISANPFLTGLDTSVAPLTNICTLLRGIPVYYPSVIGQMYADPRLDTGDFVTLQTTDGTSPYVVPVMRQTLHWGGVCKATLVASGNQQRAVPSDLIDNNLSTTVNGRKILEGVDAKRITVLDEDENILFNADTETDEVYIAGFTVENDKFTHSLTQEMSGHDGYNETYTTYVGNYDVQTYYYGYRFPTGETPYQYNDFTSVQHDEIYMVDNDQDNPDYPDNSRIARFTPGMGFFFGEKGAVTIRTKSTGSNPVGFTAPRIGIYYDVANGYGLDLSGGSTSIRAWDGTNSAKMSASDGIVLSDGTYTKTITASGPTVEGGNSSSDTSVPNNTITELASFDIDEPGTYIITATARFASNATGARRFCIRTGDVANISTNLVRELQAYVAAASGATTCVNICGIQTFTQSNTLHLYVQQHSGGSLGTSWAWHYVRLA